MNNKAYHTRYGLMTAEQAAELLLDRSWERLRFLEEIFAVVDQYGDGVTLSGYAPRGLGAILQDISIDVATARDYYTGDDSTPGCTFWIAPKTPSSQEAKDHE